MGIPPEFQFDLPDLLIDSCDQVEQDVSVIAGDGQSTNQARGGTRQGGLCQQKSEGQKQRFQVRSEQKGERARPAQRRKPYGPQLSGGASQAQRLVGDCLEKCSEPKLEDAGGGGTAAGCISGG